MITTVKGNYIQINGLIEWTLFYRMIKKIHPVEFLRLTDSIIQLPNFLFFISLLVCSSLKLDLWVVFLVPGLSFFLGMLTITFRLVIGDIKLLKLPLTLFSSGNLIFILVILFICFLILHWWTLILIPVYIITATLSLLILTTKEKKFYRTQWDRNVSNLDVFKNNSFLCSYKFYASMHGLPLEIEMTVEEFANQDWNKAHIYMKENWETLKPFFLGEAKTSWENYLSIESSQE